MKARSLEKGILSFEDRRHAIEARPYIVPAMGKFALLRFENAIKPRDDDTLTFQYEEKSIEATVYLDRLPQVLQEIDLQLTKFQKSYEMIDAGDTDGWPQGFARGMVEHLEEPVLTLKTQVSSLLDASR